MKIIAACLVTPELISDMKRTSFLVLLCCFLFSSQVFGEQTPGCPWLSHLHRIFGEGDEPAVVAVYRSGRAGEASALKPTADRDSRLLIPYLMGAAEGGHLELVKKLLKQGVDPGWGLEPAAAGGAVNVFNLLLEQGCIAGERELNAAAESGCVKIVSQLLKSESELGYLMHRAVSAGQIDVVKLLLEHGAQAEYALDSAVETGHVEMVKLLLEKGYYPCIMESIMASAAGLGHDEVVRLLLEKGGSASDALSGAASAGNMDMVQQLLEYGANPAAGMEAAASYGHEKIVKLLLEKGVSADYGISEAAGRGYVEIVSLLLEKGASANHGISEAAGGGHEEIVRLLLEHGADAGHGLSIAAGYGHVEMVRLLLEHGASPELGLVPAVERGHVEIVEMLHRAGARLPQEQLLPLAVKEGKLAMVAYLAKQGCNPTAGLGGAVEQGNMEMVRLLLEKGAVPGGFELRTAAQRGYAEILKLILPLAQAEINAANWLGQTPLDLASQHGHEKCAALLRAAGGKCKGE